MGIAMTWDDKQRRLSLRLADGSRMRPPLERRIEVHLAPRNRHGCSSSQENRLRCDSKALRDTSCHIKKRLTYYGLSTFGVRDAESIVYTAPPWFRSPGSDRVLPACRGRESLEPIIYTVKISSPEKHIAEVVAAVPAKGCESIELMMPIWSPGYYRVEDYAKRVSDLSARTQDGRTLDLTHPKQNRWLIRTAGSPKVIVSYRISCEQRSVTTNWISEDLAVLNGAATFVTVVEKVRRPHDIRLELPSRWSPAKTALDPRPTASPTTFRRGLRHSGRFADPRWKIGGARIRGRRQRARVGGRGRHRKQLGWQARCTRP